MPTHQWFESDPDRAPDSDFEPGSASHLCVGNEGRLLDSRRTPVRVKDVWYETGLAGVEILAFEDRGAVWDVPFEEVGKYQFYRMESCEGPLQSRRRETALVSASFRMDIVQEMSGWTDSQRTVALYRQAVPVERVFMTYLETEAMNQPFREAEAVLLADPSNQAF